MTFCLCFIVSKGHSLEAKTMYDFWWFYWYRRRHRRHPHYFILNNMVDIVIIAVVDIIFAIIFMKLFQSHYH